MERVDKHRDIVKTCVKCSLSKRLNIGFQDQLSLNAGQKYCRMLSWSILQYIRPSLSYHLSLRFLFCLYLSGHFTQVLLCLVCQDKDALDMWAHS